MVSKCGMKTKRFTSVASNLADVVTSFVVTDVTRFLVTDVMLLLILLL